MKISIITLFPNMISAFTEESIIKRAIDKGTVEVEFINLRDFALNEYGTVDDRPYGGGAGMILRVEPIFKALKKIKGLNEEKLLTKTVLTSPKGKTFNQLKAKEYSKLDHLIVIAGHYEEVDERIREFCDEEVSLGDFVMTGGEITAAAIIDSIVRLLPGVLKKEDATELESFFNVELKTLISLFPEDEILMDLNKKNMKNVQLLEYPQYTRPEEFNGSKVPSVLLSGHQKNIEQWKIKMAYEETKKKRPDLLR